MKTQTLSLAALALATSLSSAAEFEIGGGSFANLLDVNGDNLAAGSIVQVGYFLGVPVDRSGVDFIQADWDSFTPLLSAETFNASNGFESVFQFNNTFDTDLDAEVLPTSFPVQLGFRIFDSTTSPDGANFNTVLRDVSTWTLNDPTTIPAPTPPSPTINSTDDTLIFWEDSSNPFQTSIEAIPEPSTSLSALLGFALLAGSRRRK